MTSYKEAFHHLRRQLQPLYDAGEATAISKEVMEGFTGISYSQSLIAGGDQLPQTILTALEEATAQLLQGRPMQYVLGYAWFMDRKFMVNENVLIPRPETEELVQWIFDDLQGRAEIFSVLDIGTGSGCIPISLKLALDNAIITSCDISEGALAIATRNAALLQADIQLLQLDFLDPEAQQKLGKYDIIVSNPPYIPIAEQVGLHPNVRDYEPGTALFVPDEDALLFYRYIAAFAKAHLNEGGAIYCELHKDHALAAQALFKVIGYQNPELRKDLNGHWRMIKITS